MSNVVVALILVAVGAALGKAATPADVVTVTDTLAGQAYARRLARERLRTDGLRARLEGVQRLTPARVIVTDTVVPPPDTVLRFVSIKDGQLSAEFLSTVSVSIDSGVASELHTGFDISECDDGFEVSASGVFCDPAQLGHLWIGPSVTNTDPMLSAWWRPSYRSPWEAWAGYGTRLHLGLRYGVRLF